jgi:hypothetical protein
MCLIFEARGPVGSTAPKRRTTLLTPRTGFGHP